MCETSTTTKPKVVAQLVNEMRALIQEMITIIAVTEKLSKGPNTSCNKPRETGKNSGALTSEVTSVTGPLQTPSKRKTKETPPSMGRDMVQKLGK